MTVRLEPLERRRHLTATTRVAPGFGLVKTDLGGFRDVATHVAALPGGRALVAGLSVRDDKTYTLRNVFVLYTAKGQRDPAFGRDGVLMLSPKQAVDDGSVTGLVALPDGSVLVENNGVRRLKPDGVFDGRFGKFGKLNGIVGNAFVNADGTINAVESLSGGTKSDGGQFRVHAYDAGGHETGVSAALPGRPTRLGDGRVVGITADNRVTLYGPSMTPDSGFGKNGLVELNAALKTWTTGQGRWYSGGQKVASPKPRVIGLSAAGDGGFIADAVYRGSVRRSASDTLTRIPIRLDAKGNVVRVNDSSSGRVGVTFTPSAGKFGGTFRFGTGGPVALPATVFGEIYAASRSADGSYFLAGEVDGHAAVLRTKPVVGSVKGTAFADANRDGRQQPTEAFAADTLIYLDANNNGKMDDAEARTRTDASGNYRFADVGPCTFVVRRAVAAKRVTTPARVQTLIAGNHLVVPLGMAA